MPDTPSPFDDPLADLYGRLPDARHRRGDAPAGGAPLSRREARAARENATGEQPTAATPPESESATPAPEPAAPAIPEPTPSAPPAPEPPAPAPVRASAAPSDPIASVSGPAFTRAQAPERAPARSRQAPGPARSASSSAAAPTGTLDDLFTGERNTEEVGAMPSAKERRRRRAGGWIALGIVVAILGGITAGGFWAWNTFGTRIQEWAAGTTVDDFDEGQAHGEAQIVIAEGDAGGQVSQKVFDAGVTKTDSSLYDYMIENSVAFTFQPGVYALQLEMTSPAVLEALADPENRIENRAQLREGLTVEASIQAISEQMSIPLEELQAAVADPAVYGVSAPRLEGWLFPATYDFDPGVSASDVIGTMVNRTVQSLDSAGVPVDDRERVLTVASIIEREGRTPDFPRVSRVIQNRLDQGMRLQMDSTAQYGYGELHAGSASTSNEAQYDENEWNTYVIDGLPATPIANPGDAAIDAAMHPADGPWLFFVTVNLETGETVFTNTADEHQAAVEQWIEWCRANPGSGC